MGIVGVQFFLTPSDLRLLKLNTALGTGVSDSFLSISSGSNVVDRGNELRPLSSAQAEQVTSVTPDTTRPQFVTDGFVVFDLNSGQFTVAFDEPMNTAVTTPVDIFQHQASTVKPSDIFTLQGVSCVAPECQNNETITFTLPRAELNRLKLAPRVCFSGSTCWFTIPAPGDFIRDMSGNPVQAVPNGDRSSSRLPLTFVNDVVGPVLEAYTLNLTSRELVLSFDEPVEADSFNTTGIMLQSGRGVSGDAQAYRLTSGVLVPAENSADVVIVLSDADVNAIQSRPDVASSMSSTYLVMESYTARDLSYRQTQAQAIASDSALLVSVFESDRVPPQIRAFNLDLDSNSMAITFTEPVRIDSLNLEQLVVLSSRSDGVTYNITGGNLELVSLAAASVVEFTLLDEDATFLEASADVATSLGDTFLAAGSGLAQDTNALTSQALPASEAIQVSGFIEDTSPANVESFTLDMDEGEAVVIFDDVILGSTFDVGSLTFQSGATRVPLDWHTLSPASSTGSSTNGFQVTVDIGSSDLNRLKQIRNLTTGLANSYLTVTATLADDVNGVDVIAITDGNALQASRFTPDGRRPSLSAWTLDLDEGQVILMFSETVDIRTLQPSEVTLVSSPSSTDTYALTGFESLIPPDAQYRFAIQLSSVDANAIKARLTLGTEQSNSHLFLTRNAIEDTSGNDMTPILTQNALQASAYVADETGPVLLAFSLDFDTMLLRLSFDETVDAGTFNVTALALVDRVASPNTAASYALTDSSSSSVNAAVIDISVSPRDLNAIKAINTLATSSSDTYITATAYAVRDIDGNRLAAVTADSPVQVSAYSRDTVPPSLVSFAVDMSSEQLLLTFSETVTILVDPTQITLQNEVSTSIPGVISIILRGGTVTRGEAGTTIAIQLEEDDANELKRITTIATSTENTFIQFSSNTVQDPAGNLVDAVAETNALQASSVVADTVPPRLEGFSLDLDLRQLVLSFDETVDSSTFAATLITLQDAPSSPLQSVELGSFSRTDSPNGVQLLVELSPVDFNAITATFPLATMDMNTYISVQEGVVSDTVGVASMEVSVDDALLITSLTADLMRPSLESFDFDLDNGVLTLEFSESVNVTSFDATQITIQSSPSSPTHMQTLRAGVVAQRENTILDVTLNGNDLNDIKRLTQLASARSDTYLSLTSATVSDMNGNMVVAISMSSALLVRGYIVDTTSPVLGGFDLGYDDGVLTLYLDETVDLSTFQVGGVTLQSDIIGLGSGHMLTDSVMTNSGYETFIQVQLSSFDLNELKRLRICTSMESCFLSASDAVVMDVSLEWNRNAPIPSTTARSVGAYIPDLSRPLLARYTEFDLDAGTFTLEFSETVDVSTVNATQITLDSSYTNTTFSFDFESLTTVTGGDNYNVTFQLQLGDLNLLKLNTELCTYDGNCWIRFTDGFIADVSGNEIIAVLPNTIDTFHQLSRFTPDVTPPVLLSYTIDLDSGAMTFVFDEVVRLGTFTPMNITFQDTDDDPTSMLSLREYGDFARSEDGLTIEWNMTVADLNLLKSYEGIFSSPSDSYLTYSNFVEDISGTGIGFRSSALAVRSYVPDTTRPQLQYFRAFNFDNATLTLQFDEPVNISSIMLSGGLAIARNETFDLHIYDRVYINDWYSVLYENGTIYNLTHTFHFGEYVLDCPFSLFPTPESPIMSSMMTTMMMEGSGSGSGSGNANDSTDGMLATAATMAQGDDDSDEDFYPILLRGCDIFHNLTVVEPFLFLTGSSPSPSYVDERKQQVLIPLNRADLRELKLSFTIATDDSDTWIAFNGTDLLDMAGNEVRPSNLFNATRLQSGRFVDDVTPPTFEFVVLDMDASVLFLNFNDIMDLQSVNPLLVEISEYPGSNNSYILQGPYPYPTPLFVDLCDNYTIAIPLAFDDMNTLKNNLDLATSELNTYVAFPSEIATDIYGRNPIEDVADVQVRVLVPDETGPVLEALIVDYERRILDLIFDEVVNPNTVIHFGITIQSVRNSSIFEGEEFVSYTFTEGGAPVDNSTGVSTLSLLLDVDLNALITTPGLGETVNDTFIAIEVETVLDMNDNPNQRVNSESALQASDVMDDTSPPFLVYYDLDLNDNLLVLKFSEAVLPNTFNTSAITLQSTATFVEGVSESVSLSQNSRIVWRDFNSLLFIQLTMGDEEDIKNPRSSLAKSAESTFLSIEREAAENYFGFRVLNVSSEDAVPVRQYFEGVFLCMHKKLTPGLISCHGVLK